MVRPDFNKNMRIKDFQSYYWYKTELQQICKKHSLPITRTKAELTAYIIKLLAGVPVPCVNYHIVTVQQNVTGLVNGFAELGVYINQQFIAFEDIRTVIREK